MSWKSRSHPPSLIAVGLVWLVLLYLKYLGTLLSSALPVGIHTCRYRSRVIHTNACLPRQTCFRCKHIKKSSPLNHPLQGCMLAAVAYLTSNHVPRKVLVFSSLPFLYPLLSACSAAPPSIGRCLALPCPGLHYLSATYLGTLTLTPLTRLGLYFTSAPIHTYSYTHAYYRIGTIIIIIGTHYQFCDKLGGFLT